MRFVIVGVSMSCMFDFKLVFPGYRVVVLNLRVVL